MLLAAIPKLAPDFGDVYFFMAKALLDLGDPSRFAEAIGDVKPGFTMAPPSSTAPLGHYVLADIYRLQGRRADSSSELAKG